MNRLLQHLGRLSGRSRAIGLFFATSLAGRLISIGCQLCQVPLAVHALGNEAFGLWMTLTSVSFVITFADFGVGQGTQNHMAEAFAVDRPGAVAELLGSSFVFMSGMAVVLAAAVAYFAPHIDYTRVFRLTDPAVQRQAAPAVTATLLLCCGNLPLGLAQRLAYARQEGWKHNLAQAAGAAGTLIATWIAARRHWSLTAFMVGAQLPLLAANAVLLVLLLPRGKGLRYRCRGAVMRRLLSLGSYFAVQQVHVTVLLAVPPIMLSTVLGAAAVTPYNLAQRLFNVFAVIQNAFMLPLWPAYSEAMARSDHEWIRRTLWRSLAATLLCTIAPAAIGAALAHPVFVVWLHHGADLPHAGLIWALFFWNAAVFLEQPFGYLLSGISEIRKVTRYSIISGFASLVLMSIGVRRFGAEGLVLGMFVGYLPYLCIGAIGETCRMMRTTLRAWPRSAPWSLSLR